MVNAPGTGPYGPQAGRTRPGTPPSGGPVQDGPLDWEPVITRPDPMTEDELTAAEIAEIGEATESEARAAANAARSGTTAPAAIAAYAGRRGPGQPGSAGVFPGESASRAAAFGAGLALDVMPGCPDLAVLASTAAGPDDTYDGARTTS